MYVNMGVWGEMRMPAMSPLLARAFGRTRLCAFCVTDGGVLSGCICLA